MKRKGLLHKAKLALSMIAVFVFVFFGIFGFDQPPLVHAQQPTGSIPTVTGTPSGPTARVDPSLIEGVLVYAGPSTFDYLPVGVLLENETVFVLGRARGKDEWLHIYYPGVPGSTAWLYALYIVELSPGAIIPNVEIPATPTPNSTPTINPRPRTSRIAGAFLMTFSSTSDLFEPQDTATFLFSNPAGIIAEWFNQLNTAGNFYAAANVLSLSGAGSSIAATSATTPGPGPGPAPVPEPATMILLSCGMACLTFFGRRKFLA